MNLAKIAVGTSRLYDESQLRASLVLYREHQLRPFLGGQCQEYVLYTAGSQRPPSFPEEAACVGFRGGRGFRQCGAAKSPERREQIGVAREIGFAVFREVVSESKKSEAAGLTEAGKSAFKETLN